MPRGEDSQQSECDQGDENPQAAKPTRLRRLPPQRVAGGMPIGRTSRRLHPGWPASLGGTCLPASASLNNGHSDTANPVV